MGDRELLELAARAAGIHLHHWFDGHGVFMCSSVDGGDPDYGWNPLTDDGDALRLMVRLNLSFQSYPLWDRAQAWHPGSPENAPEEKYGKDRCAAARRAIVRAAAEIGRQMGGEQ